MLPFHQIEVLLFSPRRFLRCKEGSAGLSWVTGKEKRANCRNIQLWQRADEALYQAKDLGRNPVCLHTLADQNGYLQ